MVVGAGLAGLVAADVVSSAGLDVVVLEASDGVGGRIRTDAVDGMLLDRGFQLLNPAYPAVARRCDLPALRLQPFDAGVVVAGASGNHVLVDPRRHRRGLLQDLPHRTGSLTEKAAFARYGLGVALRPVSSLRRRPDLSWGAALDAAGVGGELRHRVLEPFLAGVLGEDNQETSRRFVDLLLRTFALGRPALPAAGMQALPEQLAARLPAGCVRTGSPVRRVTRRQVATDDGSWRCEVLLVATDPVTAAGLCDLRPPVMRALTTCYFRAEHSPVASGRPLLHVDGDRRGPVVNTAVVSDAAPTYCRAGSLIAATVLGGDAGPDLDRQVRGQLGLVYGSSTDAWERVATYVVQGALPAMLPPLQLRQQVALGDGLFVAGDHRDTASIQGALVSGGRAGAAVVRRLSGRP